MLKGAVKLLTEIFQSTSSNSVHDSSERSEGIERPEGWLNESLSFEELAITKWETPQLKDFIDGMKLKKLFFQLKQKGFGIENGLDLLFFFTNYVGYKEILNSLPPDTAKESVILEVLMKNVVTRGYQKINIDFYRLLVKMMHQFEKEDVLKKKKTVVERAQVLRNISVTTFEKNIHELSDFNSLRKKFYDLLNKYVIGMKKRILEDEKENKKEDDDNNKESRVFSISVMLVITETIRNNLMRKRIRKIISPILNKIERYEQDFGMFHAALIVGPLYLEWTTCAMVQLKELQSSKALCTIDFEDIGVLRSNNIDEIAYKIAGHVHKWNTKVLYSGAKSSENEEIRDSKKGNCQHFVKELMETLNVKYNKKTYQRIINSLRRGEGKREFHPSEKIKEVLTFNKKVYSFKTHKELDEFVVDIRNKLENKKVKLESFVDFKVLKSFDRAFWLRFLKSERSEKELRKKINDRMKKIKILRKEDDDSEEEEEGENEDKKTIKRLEKTIARFKIDLKMISSHSPSVKGCPFGDPRLSKTLFIPNS